MKKILILVLLFAGAAGAVLYFSRSTSPVESEYYADYLPVETLATVSLIDLKGLTDSFPASSLGRFLAKPTVHGIMTELGAAPEDIDSYDEMYDGLAGVMTNPAFRQVFGDDAVLAVLSPDPARLRTEPEQEVQHSLLVFGTSSVSGPLDSFARLVMSKSVTKETVEGLNLTRIQLDENEVIYGYADGSVLVLAYAPDSIAQAIKQKQAGGGLQESAFFAAAKKFWSGSAEGREYAHTYVNIAQIRTLFAASEEQKARDAANFLQGFKGAGSVIVDQQGELNITTRMEYDFASLNELIRHQYQSISKENLSLDLLTPQTLVYYWASTLDKEFVKGLLSATDEKQYKQAEARVQKELGLSLDEIVAAVGPQSGVVVNEIVNTGLFPLPKAIFFLQIRDHKVAQQVLDNVRSKIAERGFAAEQSQEVNGHTIYFWSVLPGEATQPAMVLTDNMLYIANGKSSLEALVAGDRSQAIVPADMAANLGPELVTMIESSNYNTFIMSPARLATEVKDAADWLSGMMAATKGVSAEKLKQEILTLMHSVDIVTATSDIQKDHAVSALVFKQAASVVQDKK
ncbi:MAG: DUF3352 domain-containing protein [Thermodesulfobacteriota bacterium]|nr:DUF3352 domain-containing protein [Thermodesulfobacteriota bacterium]